MTSEPKWDFEHGPGTHYLRKNKSRWLWVAQRIADKEAELLAILNSHDALVGACRSASYACYEDADEVARIEAHRDIVEALRLAGEVLS